MERKALGLICFCYILLKIQEKARGFNYEPDSEALRRYVMSMQYLRKRYPARMLVEYANVAHKYANVFLRDRGKVQQYLALRLSGEVEIANDISFGDDWHEIPIVWMKFYIATNGIKLADMPVKVKNTARMLGISHKQSTKVIRTLFTELLDELIPLESR